MLATKTRKVTMIVVKPMLNMVVTKLPSVNNDACRDCQFNIIKGGPGSVAAFGGWSLNPKPQTL